MMKEWKKVTACFLSAVLLMQAMPQKLMAAEEEGTKEEEQSFSISYKDGSFVEPEAEILDSKIGTIQYERTEDGSKIIEVAVIGTGNYFARQKSTEQPKVAAEIIADDENKKIEKVIFHCPEKEEGTLTIEMLTDSAKPKVKINGTEAADADSVVMVYPEDNANAEIKMEVSDSESGVRKVEYREENGEYKADPEHLTPQGEDWYYREEVNETKKIDFRITDYYGYCSEAAVQINVDKEAPEICLDSVRITGVEAVEDKGVNYWGEAENPTLEFTAVDENEPITAEYFICKKGQEQNSSSLSSKLESKEEDETGKIKEMKLDESAINGLENGRYVITAEFQDNFKNKTDKIKLYEFVINRTALNLNISGEAAHTRLNGSCTAYIGEQEIKKDFGISEGISSELSVMNQGEIKIAFDNLRGIQITKIQLGEEDITKRYRDGVLTLDKDMLEELRDSQKILDFHAEYVRKFTVSYENGRFCPLGESILNPEIGSVSVSEDGTKLEVSGAGNYFAKQSKGDAGKRTLEKEIISNAEIEKIDKVVFACPKSGKGEAVIEILTDSEEPQIEIEGDKIPGENVTKIYVDENDDFSIIITAKDKDSGIKKVEKCEKDSTYGDETDLLYAVKDKRGENWYYSNHVMKSRNIYFWASDYYDLHARATVQIIVDHDAPVIVDKDKPGAIQSVGMVSRDDAVGNHYWARSDAYGLRFQVQEANPPIQASCTITDLNNPDSAHTFQTELVKTSADPVSTEGIQTWEMELNLDVSVINDLKDGTYQMKAALTDAAGNTTEPDMGLTYTFHLNSQKPKLVQADKAEEYWLKVPADQSAGKEIPASITSCQPIAELSYAVTECRYADDPGIWENGKYKEPEDLEEPAEDAWQKVPEDRIRISAEEAAADIAYQLPAGTEKDGTVIYYLWVKDALEHTTHQQIICHFDSSAPRLSNFKAELKHPGTSAMRAFQYIFGSFLKEDETLLLSVDAQDFYDASRYAEKPSVETVELYYMEQDCTTPDDSGQEQRDNEESYQELAKRKASVQKIKADHTADKKGEGNRNFQFRLKVNRNNKFYKLYFVATDRAGNHRILNAASLGGSGTSPLVMVDDKKPVISSQLQESCTQADYQVTRQNKQMRWYQGGRKIAYDLSVTDKESGIFSIGASINGTAVTTDAKGKTLYDSSTAEDFEDLERETGFSYVIQPKKGKAGADGGYKVELRAEDNAGNVRKVSDQLYVDEDAPVISNMTFDTGEEDTLATVPVQYGYFFQKKTEVTVYATDYIGTGKVTGSGVAFIHYQLMPADGSAPITGKLTVKEGKDGVCTAQFTVPEGFKGQLELKAEDHAGQSSPAYNPKGAVVETPQEHSRTSKAEILLPKTDYRDSEGNPLYSGDIQLELDTADSRSGLKQNVWSLREYYAPENLGGGTLDIASIFDESQRVFHSALSGDGGWEVPGVLELNLVSRAGKKMTVSSDTNHLAAALQITDQAGNTSAARPRVFSIDKTAPAVQVKYDNNEAQNQKYYKEKRTATITVTDANFSPEDCEFILTGPKPEISEWKHQPGEGCNGNVHTAECSYTCQAAFTEDGDYTFAFRCKDLAGHTAAYQNTDEFTIDTAKPVIRVSYDNNSASSGSYYSKARTATLEIEDKNFDPARTQVEITAQKDGALAEAPSVSQFTQNGDIWSATVRYAEDGDYTFHMASTDQAGNPADDYAQESFTIDQTPPSLEIQGVEDHSANKGTVAPVIRTGDINLDEGSLTVTLTGANHGPVAYEAEKQQTGKEIEMHMADFKQTQETDDLYTLTVQAADRAGNKAEQTCTFSVNRFGSVYLLEEQTSRLVDQFYTNQEQEVVIIEYNVDTLQFGEISYSLDGTIVTLEKGTDYEVESQTDEGSWKKYEYHVLAKNFQQEGSYVVSLYSEDLARNKSSNKVKGKEVAFVVDKTKPTIVVAGVEDQGQYVDVSRSITVDTQDNILLESVGVYTDGQKKVSAGREELLDHDGQVNLSLAGSNQSQELYVEARDAAGNVARSADIRFLITKNLLVQWTSNLPLCVGSITATAAAGAAGVLGLRRRKLRFKR